MRLLLPNESILVGVGSYLACGISGRVGYNVSGGVFKKYYFPLMPVGEKISGELGEDHAYPKGELIVLPLMPKGGIFGKLVVVVLVLACMLALMSNNLTRIRATENAWIRRIPMIDARFISRIIIVESLLEKP